MKRDEQQLPSELIELGTPSGDTHGPGGYMPEAAGLWHKAGLSRD